MTKKKQKQKIILPPELPPEVKEEDIDVSDEDLEFVNENRDYAGFVSRLDTASITRQVTRVADLEGDELEAAYEKRLKKKALKQKLKQEDESRIEVDRVDALPVKTLDGKLHYRTVSKKPEDGDDEKDDNSAGGDKGLTKLTKPEKRAKLKRSKKEAKQQEKDLEKDQEVEQVPQTAVLAEIQEDLTSEELFERKKLKLAELGIALLADPESNIKSLKEMFQFCKDADHSIVKLGLLSLLAVFKDIIPGYRIRLPTEKELEMKISKEIKKMRFYESTLLSTYKAYLQKLMVLAKDSKFKHVATRCVCTLLEAVPHFNFRESLMDAVVENIGSPDHIIRKLCCGAIKSLFTNEGKHGGEATVEAVQLIAGHVKARDCLLHADSVEVFLSLSFDEDLGKRKEEEKERGGKYKKYKKRKNGEEPVQLQENDRKRSKKEMMTRMSEEVAADYKAAAFTPDVKEQRRRQVETLSAVFETYFRILRHTLQSTIASSKNDGNFAVDASGNHPLLAPCLNGLGKFSHLIDMDYIGDLMNYLKKLAGGDSSSGKPYKCLSISERLKCCIVAFKVMKINLDALNVDLQGFFVLLYNLILEYRPGRDQGDVLAEALKVMLFEDRQQDMQKAAAFAKRLATFSLCFGSAESMAAMVTLKSILQKNVKCRNLLENDAGGGSVSGIIAKYQPFASDPNLSGALASVLWELNLLSEHFHPAISTMASSISSMSASHNQVYISLMSPQQAFAELSLQRELLNPKYDVRKSNSRKRKGSSKKVAVVDINQDATLADEDKLRKKLSDHFVLLRDVKENERLMGELDRTTLALQLYDEYTKQKKLKQRA